MIQKCDRDTRVPEGLHKNAQSNYDKEAFWWTAL